MAATEHNESVFTVLVDLIKRDDLLIHYSFLPREVLNVAEVRSGYTFDNKVVNCQGTRLVEAADVDFSSVWDSEGLRAENLFLNHRYY